MRKKKHKIVETSPLQAYTIGKIKENKFGFIKLIILFGLFFVVVFYLPDLSILYQKFIIGGILDPSAANTSNNGNVTNNITNNVTNNIVVDNKYYFEANRVIEVNNIEFNTIEANNNEISFNAKNLLTTSVDIEKQNIYFELYDENDNLLKRYAILGILKPNEEKIMTFNFDGEANYFDIKEILEDDYTYIDLKYDDNNLSYLICIKNSEKIMYTFLNEKLTKISFSDLVSKQASDYDAKYTLYNEMYVKYRKSDGISAVFNTANNELKYNITIDYTKFEESINNRLLFEKDVSPRVINFKVESWEYECS